MNIKFNDTINFFFSLIHEHVDHVIIAKIVKSHSRYLTFSFHLFSEVERPVLYFMRFYFYDFNALKFDPDLWPISEVWFSTSPNPGKFWLAKKRKQYEEKK